MKLPNPFRTAKKGDASPPPTTGHYLADAGHRDFTHPVDHVLPQGTVNRGDELVWVATQIELHAQAGTLDEGTPFVLDAEINHRHAQWDDAIDHEAIQRVRTAKALYAEESEHLTSILEELKQLRTELRNVQALDNHWLELLYGAPVTTPPKASNETIAAPASIGLTLAQPTAAAGPSPWAAPTATYTHKTASTTDTEGELP